MAKLHQQLETLFGARFNSNSEIIATIKKLSEAGKFDEPKKVAVFALILDRLGKKEDEETIEESLKTDDNDELDEIVENAPDFVVTPETPVETVPATSPDAPTEPEVTPGVQAFLETPVATAETPIADTTPVETAPTPPIETPTDPVVETPPATDSPTVAKFTPENITDPVTPPDPTTST